MKRKLFAIPSLLAAGFLPSKGFALPLSAPPALDPKKTKSMFDVFRLDHRYILAGHRSHSSHSSHSSHRSSTGGGYYTPLYTPPPSYATPLYTPPVAPKPVAPAAVPSGAANTPKTIAPGEAYPSQPAPALAAPIEVGSNPVPPAKPKPVTLPGNTDKFAAIVKQVQTAMVAFGYFEGPVDGKVGASTREALTRLQTDYGLKATGTITPETLDALRIQAR